MSVTPLVSASYARPADATQYSIGDIVANSGTAASVVPIIFPNAAQFLGSSGWLLGVRCTLGAASGTIVLPNFDLLIFQPATAIPFAAGGYPADNAALAITLLAMNQQVAVYNFLDTGWRNESGGATASGKNVNQSVGLTKNGRTHASFNLSLAGGTALYALLQAQNTWNPGAVINTFNFTLDILGD